MIHHLRTMTRKALGWIALALGIGYYVWLFLTSWAETLPEMPQ